MPQLRFNEDGQWHDFAPEGGTGLKAGPWFPYLELYGDGRLSDHRVDRPKPTKSAGKTKSAAAATSAAAPVDTEAGSGAQEEGGGERDALVSSSDRVTQGEGAAGGDPPQLFFEMTVPVELLDRDLKVLTKGDVKWLQDSSAVKCMNQTCLKSFGLTRRRHHCRGCGHIYCSACSVVHSDQEPLHYPMFCNERLCEECKRLFKRAVAPSTI